MHLNRWLGLKASEGMQGLEQPIAYSAERGLVVSHFVPGIELFEIGKMDEHERDQHAPSEQQLDDFAATFRESIIADVVLDYGSRDILMDVEGRGLTMIDQGVRMYGPRERAVGATSAQTARAGLFANAFYEAYGFDFDREGLEQRLKDAASDAAAVIAERAGS